MKISTIIPTYNSAKTLERAIKSVLQQTLPAHEIIIIDDGSVDETPEVINRFQGKIKYIKQTNSGVSAARNTGIKESSGNWIAFLDADDEWLPSKLELQSRILKKKTGVKWCAGEVQIVRRTNCTIITVPKTRKIEKKWAVHFFEACLKGIFFQTSTFLISRQLFSEIGTFDPSLRVSEDRDLWWRIATLYPEIGYVSEVCSHYYLDTPSSLTKKNNNRTESLRVVCRHIDRARDEKVDAALYYKKYMNHLCFQYLLRCASREIILSSEIRNNAENLINITAPERILLIGLKSLPEICARSLVKLFSLLCA
jgi:glycosyltransferase involved in cell wall biosynthesis